jgi:hypothetical protein
MKKEKKIIDDPEWQVMKWTNDFYFYLCKEDGEQEKQNCGEDREGVWAEKSND